MPIFFVQDELYQLCVTDTRPTVAYYEDSEIVRAPVGPVEVQADCGAEGDVEESCASEEEHDDMPPTPVVATASATPIRSFCDETDGPKGVNVASTPMAIAEDDSPRRRRAMAESAFFNT